VSLRRVRRYAYRRLQTGSCPFQCRTSSAPLTASADSRRISCLAAAAIAFASACSAALRAGRSSSALGAACWLIGDGLMALFGYPVAQEPSLQKSGIGEKRPKH
jgi:hypothetical protein